MTALANGTQLGRYEIRSEIGAGGMREVLEQAWEEREGNLIYLKHLALLIPGLEDHPRVAGLPRRIGLPE